VGIDMSTASLTGASDAIGGDVADMSAPGPKRRKSDVRSDVGF
jgi:hypothetical protein